MFISTHAARAALSAAGFHGRGPGKKGGAGGGKMTISVELPARKFIESGANAADAVWRADLASLEQAVTRHLRATVAAPARRGPAP